MPDRTPVEPVGDQGGSGGAEKRKRILLDQASLDALLAADETEKTPAGSAPDKNLLSEDALESLIAEKSVQGAEPGDGPAADTSHFFDAATLDSLLGDDTILGSGGTDKAPIIQVDEASLTGEPAEPALSPEMISTLAAAAGQRRGLLKLVTTLAVGTVSALAVFTYLYTHQERLPDAQLYSNDPLVLSHIAGMLERRGELAEAAPNRVAAYQAKPDPAALLAAARDFRNAGAGAKAIEQYRRLMNESPGVAGRSGRLDRTLRRALLNILINAVRSIDGEGLITISTRTERKHVTIAVADTGCGIAADQLNKVFSPFYSTKEKGGGLGLAVAAKIVEGHRGRLEAESKPGQGSTFRIRLPRTEHG